MQAHVLKFVLLLAATAAGQSLAVTTSDNAWRPSVSKAPAEAPTVGAAPQRAASAAASASREQPPRAAIKPRY